MTCWRGLAAWQAEGTWDLCHKMLPDRPRGADKLDWSRALLDSGSIQAASGGEATGPSPVDRAKPGSFRVFRGYCGRIRVAVSQRGSRV